MGTAAASGRGTAHRISFTALTRHRAGGGDVLLPRNRCAVADVQGSPAQQAPEAMLTALTAFLAPYRSK
jgi:hypothetical protein